MGDGVTTGDLRRLVERNPSQGTLEEYELVLDTIRAAAPGNLLVFGVGRDSRYWVRANEGGKSVFVEHEPEWIRKTEEQLPDTRICRVSYETRRIWWRLLLRRPDRLFMDDLPDSVRSTDWDVIFVDGPQGHRWKQPGRMKSIYTASVLASNSSDVHVLIHDCDRKVERVFADTYFDSASLLGQTRTLRHYLVGPATR